LNLVPEGAAARCREAVARLVAENAVDRVWEPDASFWKVEAVARKGIENSLGWLTAPDRDLSAVSDLQAFAAGVRSGTDRVLVLAAGGAGRTARLLARTFSPGEGFPVLDVLDATEPSAVAAAASASDPARTLYVVSSRSGAAIEPNVLFDCFFDEAGRRLGDAAGERFVVVTDPGSALEKTAIARRALRIFPSDPRSRGGFGALSHFGLVPAALLGVDLKELLRRARRMSEGCRAAAAENPGLLLGAALGAEGQIGRDKLTFSMGEPAEHFGEWLEPLLAEVTGKEGRGIVPVEGEPLGRPEVYGSDRFFVRYDGRGHEDAVAAGALASLVENGHPLVSFVLRDALDIGAEMFRWQFAAAMAAHLLGVNPFDRSEVPEGEDLANAILSGARERPADSPAGPDAERLSALLASLRPGDYFAILAYLPESAEVEEALQAIRVRVRDTRRVATTVGFGPRFQQAMGQLHKRGTARGVFLQLTREPVESKAIPGRPWGFGEVVAAQAGGDLAALEARGRRVARIHLEKETAAALRELGAAVDRALAA
jgi:transaldolase/glucose-6-phosphate isomerase